MGFDYDYVTKASEESTKSGAGKIVLWIAVIIVAMIVLITLVLFLISFFKKNRRKENISGVVFCSRCDNKYEAEYGKCPYCSKRNIRREIRNVRYWYWFGIN